MEVYLDRNGQQSGPHTTAEIQAMLAARVIDRRCLAWREGVADWLPLEAAVALPAHLLETAGPPGLPAVPARAQPPAGLAQPTQKLEGRFEQFVTGNFNPNAIERWSTVLRIMGSVLVILVIWKCSR